MPATFTVVPRPLGGNHPKCTENTMISTRPTQNVGRLKPTIEPAMMVRPTHDSGLRPASRPSGMPSTMAISIAAIASSSVAGSLARMSWMAGTL